MYIDKIVSGASFCHVVRIIHMNHEIDVITDGNQKWNGAIPSFNIIADIRIKFMNGSEDIDQWLILDISIILEPSAWAIKYLIVASVSWLDFVFDIKGINLNILISIAIHKNIQLVLDRAIIDLIINEDKVRVINGLFRYDIKTWWVETPNSKLEALVYQIRFIHFSLMNLRFIHEGGL